MSRTVLSIAYPFAPVGLHAVGGAEQILTDLDAAIAATGNRSVVVACEGSTAAGELYAVPLPGGVLDDADHAAHRRHFQAAIDRALAEHEVDLVHMHGLDFSSYRIPPHIPVLVTLHMPPSWYPETIWSSLGPNTLLQCVSHAQRNTMPPSWRHCPVVENGVALSLPKARRNSQSTPQPYAQAGAQAGEPFALALGRICPEKNLHAALDAGTLAGVPVLLGGQTFPYRAHLDYFDEEILPRLHADVHGTRHRFLGPLNPARKRDLLQRARCLLLPTLAPETSSLVAMEALAAGTPVVAFRSGALPEIVEDGVTGFLVNSTAAMAEALARAGALSRKACRRAAAQRFSLSRMTRQYQELYELHMAHTGNARLCA